MYNFKNYQQYYDKTDNFDIKLRYEVSSRNYLLCTNQVQDNFFTIHYNKINNNFFKEFENINNIVVDLNQNGKTNKKQFRLLSL